MPLSYKQTKRILLDIGFVLDRTKGSHEQWRYNNKLVTAPNHDEYAIKTAKSIIQQIALASNKKYEDIIYDYNIKL